MEVIASLGRLPDPSEFRRHADRDRAVRLAEAGLRSDSADHRCRDVGIDRSAAARGSCRVPRPGPVPQATSVARATPALQRDMKAFFGTYTKACVEADALLFKTGQEGAIDEACKRAAVGKLLPDDLYVHRSALDSLEPLLRIYEGCGRAYLGEVEGANIIKIHRRSGKLSYLVYPEFDDDPHPALLCCVRLNLRTRQIECYDYAQSANPPILHRKETFLTPDHPLHAKFARLTAQEEKNGLLDDPSGIGTREGWSRRLAERGFALKGHRLVRRNGQRNSSGEA